ncbi:PREDICTED: uncharacterized protein LOC106341304 [Brassica oleracea var. oleracea]|uniref:uncharacterized protein LOC106341304 n=1 Tax=Brassica oleracea var. oleracea TaxID=109376 RepID=UPI0006A6C743|nr:PREDICTED: uncharacterized protein LOC106341304 [Brassica oleracea var. oleracea]
MSYVPPHKRNSKDPVQPSPFPPLLTKFRRNIDDLKSSYFQGNGIVYSGKYFTKWFLVSSNGIEDEVPPSVNLVPLSSDSSDCINGLKALELMNNDFHKDMITEESEEEERTRWLLVAEKVADDLVFAYEQANKRKEDHEISDNAKLRLVARFGKIVFYGRKAGPVVDYSLKNSRRIFSTDVPTSFIQNIKSNAITSHEFCIDGEKEKYIVKITGPNEIISCKCTVKEDGRLSMYKVELNPERHLTIDVSCTVKNLDVRLMLAGKRKINTLTENELSNIQGLLSSAIVDLNVKGRLRWPLGTTSSEGGYKIFEVCHVKVTIYKKHTLGLKVRETDGFSERNGTGEIAKGVTLILKEMNTKLQEQNIERGCVLEMLRGVLGTIWDFMSYDGSLM